MKAHGDVSQGGIFKFSQPKWQKRQRRDSPYADDYDHCSYCGSISPHDFEAVLAIAGVGLECADMKYGWPHKFYVDGVPNAIAGQDAPYGSTADNGVRTELRAPAPATQQLKFYSEHLIDLCDDDFNRIRDVIRERSGIEFIREAEGMKWRRVVRQPTN